MNDLASPHEPPTLNDFLRLTNPTGLLGSDQRPSSPVAISPAEPRILPAMSNTGGTDPTNPTVASPSEHQDATFIVHWLSLTLRRQADLAVLAPLPVPLIQNLVTTTVSPSVTISELWVPGAHHRFYRSTLAGPYGAYLKADPRSGDDHISLDLPGEYLECLSLPELRHLLGDLQEHFTVRCSRIDLAFNYCPFTPEIVRNAIQRGDVWSTVRDVSLSKHRASTQHANNKGGDPARFIESSSGHSLYIGRKDSDRHVVVYDWRGYTRLELASRSERAHVTFEHLLLGNVNDEAIPNEAKGILRSFVDFVYDDPDTPPVQRKPLRWWHKFMKGNTPVQLPVRRKSKKAVSQEEWLESGVARTLAKIAYTKPNPTSYIQGLVAQGTEHLDQKDWKMILEVNPLARREPIFAPGHQEPLPIPM